MTQMKCAMAFLTAEQPMPRIRARRGSPADHHAGGLAALDTDELRGLIERLERSQSDLSARVSRRAAALDTPVGAPQSDPLYQQLFFALAGLREQLASANRELSSRTTARTGGWVEEPGRMRGRPAPARVPPRAIDGRRA